MPLVEILHVPECANLELDRRQVRRALERVETDVEVRERVVGDAAIAAQVGMAGSPTILVEGRDVVDPDGLVASVSCRLYRTRSGVEGAPPVDAIVSALGRR